MDKQELLAELNQLAATLSTAAKALDVLRIKVELTEDSKTSRRRRKVGVHGSRRWKEQEDRDLARYAIDESRTPAFIGEKLNRTPVAIVERARKKFQPAVFQAWYRKVA